MGVKAEVEKRGRKICRFSLDKEKYMEVGELFAQIPKPLRDEYIAESIRIGRTNTNALSKLT